MATNMALKRARKAQRRKQVVAQKRRAEVLEASLPARVLRAAHAPIQHCFLTESVFDIGMGTLVLARGATPHHIALSSFLIDAFCLGIKDVIFDSVATASLSIFQVRAKPLPSFGGGLSNCRSISATTVSKRRPEVILLLAPVPRSTRRVELRRRIPPNKARYSTCLPYRSDGITLRFSAYWLPRFSEVMLQCRRST